jgi:hypothetical protein
MPPEFQIAIVKPRKQICNHLMIAYQGGQKEPQWENDCGSFLLCFLLVSILETYLMIVIPDLECKSPYFHGLWYFYLNCVFRILGEVG